MKKTISTKNFFWSPRVSNKVSDLLCALERFQDLCHGATIIFNLQTTLPFDYKLQVFGGTADIVVNTVSIDFSLLSEDYIGELCSSIEILFYGLYDHIY